MSNKKSFRDFFNEADSKTLDEFRRVPRLPTRKKPAEPEVPPVKPEVQPQVKPEKAPTGPEAQPPAKPEKQKTSPVVPVPIPTGPAGEKIREPDLETPPTKTEPQTKSDNITSTTTTTKTDEPKPDSKKPYVIPTDVPTDDADKPIKGSIWTHGGTDWMRESFSKMTDIQRSLYIIESMSSATRNPNGPKFPGYWMGTDPASDAKHKMVGGSEEQQESVLGELNKTAKDTAIQRRLQEKYSDFKEATGDATIDDMIDRLSKGEEPTVKPKTTAGTSSTTAPPATPTTPTSATTSTPPSATATSAEKAAASAAEKEVAAGAEKTASKAAGSIAKGIGKGLARQVPIAGWGLAGYDAYQRAKEGDWTGATLSAASALPVVGLPALTAQIGRDAYKASQDGKADTTKPPASASGPLIRPDDESAAEKQRLQRPSANAPTPAPSAAPGANQTPAPAPSDSTRPPVTPPPGEGKVGIALAQAGVSRADRRDQAFVDKVLGPGYKAGSAESNLALLAKFQKQSGIPSTTPTASSKQTPTTTLPSTTDQTGMASYQTQRGKVYAADFNNPSGIGWDGKGKYTSFSTPEEGVNATKNLITRYLTDKTPYIKGSPTPEQVVSTWVTGGTTPADKIQGGRYLQSVKNELEAAGVKLDDQGRIPYSPAARDAITRAIVRHETSPKHMEKFAPFLNSPETTTQFAMKETTQNKKVADRYSYDEFDDLVDRLRVKAKAQEKKHGPVDFGKLMQKLRDIEDKDDKPIKEEEPANLATNPTMQATSPTKQATNPAVQDTQAGAQATSQAGTPEQQQQRRDQAIDASTARNVADTVGTVAPPGTNTDDLAQAIVNTNDGKPLTQDQQRAISTLTPLVMKAAETPSAAGPLRTALQQAGLLAKQGK